MEHFRAGEDNLLERYLATLKPLATDPQSFFASMPDYEEKKHAFVYAAITYAPSALIAVLFTLGLALPGVILAYAFGLLGLWLWGWYFAWASRHFAPKGMDTPTGMMLLAYANAPMLLSFVPVVNAIVGIWSLVLQVIGFRARTESSLGVAIAVVVAPIVILALSGWVLMMLVGMAGFMSHLMSQPGAMPQG